MQKILFIALAMVCFYANESLSIVLSKNQSSPLQSPEYFCGEDSCGCGSGENKK
jgi:hypothetical protein